MCEIVVICLLDSVLGLSVCVYVCVASCVVIIFRWCVCMCVWLSFLLNKTIISLLVFLGRFLDDLLIDTCSSSMKKISCFLCGKWFRLGLCMREMCFYIFHV